MSVTDTSSHENSLTDLCVYIRHSKNVSFLSVSASGCFAMFRILVFLVLVLFFFAAVLFWGLLLLLLLMMLCRCCCRVVDIASRLVYNACHYVLLFGFFCGRSQLDFKFDE